MVYDETADVILKFDGKTFLYQDRNEPEFYRRSGLCPNGHKADKLFVIVTKDFIPSTYMLVCEKCLPWYLKEKWKLYE